MAQFHKVFNLKEIPNNSMKHADVAGIPLAIYNVSGKIYATTDICTHKHCLLTGGFLEGTAIECPCHGGKFDIITGTALALPCVMPIKTYRTRIINQDIEVEV